MKYSFKLLRYIALAVVMLGVVTCGKETQVADLEVIPLPRNIAVTGPAVFRLNDQTQILYPRDDESMQRTARFLAEYIQEATGLTISVGGDDATLNNCIRLQLEEGGKEAYRIQISQDEIRLTAGDREGLFRGVQTLRKSLPQGDALVDCVLFEEGVIEDAPRWGYRGVMLDVARSFYDVDFLKKTVDMMALHQLNRLHLHLSDDQGWRLEIKKYPRLTEVGAYRQDGSEARYGGYYTQSQIRDLVEYAAERFVEIVPEIDMPGHLSAALTAYPELGCRGEGYEISSRAGVRKDVLCVGKREAVDFMKDILEEVMDLFPSKLIHIGGDEVPRDRWAECPHCQRKIRQLGLRVTAGHTAEQKLQGRFNAEMQRFVEAHGRQVIGWDEMLESEVDPAVTIMAWRGLGKGFRALREGHDVVMSPCNSLYLDYYQSLNVDTEPVAIGGFVNAEMIYGAKMTTEELSSEQKSHIKGVQANLWTSYVRTPADAEYMLLPRMTALSEMAWREDDARDYDDFLSRMPRMLNRYAAMGWKSAPHLYTVDGQFEADKQEGGVRVRLHSKVDARIYYTTDGTTPDEDSELYEGGILLQEDADLCAVAYTDKGIRSDYFRKSVHFNKATLKSVKMLSKPAPRYGENHLTDGVRAYTIFGRGGWTGYHDEDMVVEVDLGEEMTISKAGVSTLIDYGSHIMDLGGLKIELSKDGEMFGEVAQAQVAPIDFTLKKTMPQHILEFEPSTARYVRMTVERQKSLPAQMRVFGATQPFVFVDELYIY